MIVFVISSTTHVKNMVSTFHWHIYVEEATQEKAVSFLFSFLSAYLSHRKQKNKKTDEV